jgi:hypothetical protein
MVPYFESLRLVSLNWIGVQANNSCIYFGDDVNADVNISGSETRVMFQTFER